MSDELKDFIERHREEFNSCEVPPGAWEKVERRLKPGSLGEKVRKLYPAATITAAAAVLLLALGYTISLLVANEPLHHPASGLKDIDPALAKVERHYTLLISAKKQELYKYDLSGLGLKDDFEQEMYNLDSAYRELKKELLKNPKSKDLNNAMKHNLRLRIRLLEQQLQTLMMIEEIQNEEQNEKIDI